MSEGESKARENGNYVELEISFIRIQLLNPAWVWRRARYRLRFLKVKKKRKPSQQKNNKIYIYPLMTMQW